jgi:hypothetical protein
MQTKNSMVISFRLLSEDNFHPNTVPVCKRHGQPDTTVLIWFLLYWGINLMSDIVRLRQDVGYHVTAQAPKWA